MSTTMSKRWLIVGSLLLLGQATAGWAEPVGTAFTYQGWLADGNQPGNGLHDFQFRLFDAAIDGEQITDTIEVNDVNVVDGHFAVELDFRSEVPSAGQPEHGAWDVFTGEVRWLEIAVRPALGLQVAGMDSAVAVELAALTPYTVLVPRQKITPTPYALHALSGGGLYDVLRWPSKWDLGLGEAPKPPGDAGAQSLFNVGKVGIGTTGPAYPLDVAGAANLNKGKTGIALTVNGKEALWSNDTYFSWGYGGAANCFADPVGIGPEMTSPAERLDVSWSGGVNARIGRYNYLGSCHSSATFVLGNNVRARTDGVNDIVVGQPHDYYGYRAITMSMEGIKFYGRTGAVKVDDPLDAAMERMRITNDGNVGIGTTTPRSMFEVGTGYTTFSTFPIVGPSLDYGTQAIGLNLVRKSDGTWEAAGDGAHNGGGAILGSIGGSGLRFVTVDSTGRAAQSLSDSQIMENVRMAITSAGNVVIGRVREARDWVGTEKLDVFEGTLRLRKIAPGTGVTVVADGNGRLWKMGSSRKYKTNVQDLAVNAEKVLELRPVKFQWTTTGQEDVGLIAEEVDGVLKDLVVEDAEGRPEAVKYEKVSLYLLQVVKDLKSENESLKQRLGALERRMDEIERKGFDVAKAVQQ